MWKWKNRVYINRPAQGHRAAVAQSRDSNRLLAPQPAELAPLEKPECKWQCWQARGLRAPVHDSTLCWLILSFFLSTNNSGSSKTHVETIIFTVIDKATEMRKVRDLSICLCRRPLSAPNQLGDTRASECSVFLVHWVPCDALEPPGGCRCGRVKIQASTGSWD